MDHYSTECVLATVLIEDVLSDINCPWEFKLVRAARVFQRLQREYVTLQVEDQCLGCTLDPRGLCTLTVLLCAVRKAPFELKPIFRLEVEGKR